MYFTAVNSYDSFLSQKRKENNNGDIRFYCYQLDIAAFV